MIEKRKEKKEERKEKEREKKKCKKVSDHFIAYVESHLK